MFDDPTRGHTTKSGHECRNNKKAEYDLEKPIAKPNTIRENKFKSTWPRREYGSSTQRPRDHPKELNR